MSLLHGEHPEWKRDQEKRDYETERECVCAAEPPKMNTELLLINRVLRLLFLCKNSHTEESL